MLLVLVVVWSPWIPVGVAHWRPWWWRYWYYGRRFIFIVVINWKPVGIPFPLTEVRVFARRPIGILRVTVFCCRIFARVIKTGKTKTTRSILKMLPAPYRGGLEVSRKSSCPLLAFQCSTKSCFAISRTCMPLPSFSFPRSFKKKSIMQLVKVLCNLFYGVRTAHPEFSQ